MSEAIDGSSGVVPGVVSGVIPRVTPALAEPTDDALVVRSQTGDRAAFEQLVRRTARLVYSRQYLESRDPHRAEDLAQDTFLLAWRSIDQVADPGGFRTWLLTVARTVAADAHRRDTRKKRGGGLPGASRAGGSDGAESTPDPSPGPTEAAERDEDRARIAAALKALPDEYSLPLTLRYIGGADYETIGRQLGLSNGSLRGLLSRGLAKLREKLKN